jgi:glyoxylase-like metal-dependent hydrolase (beta-lactamase superfamily II)
VITNIASGARGFTSNAFLVAGERTVLVDAGNEFDAVARVRERVDEGALDAVVLTHSHPDHVGNVAALREAFGVETYGFDPALPAVDLAIADGDTVRLGDDDYLAVHTPGHAADHLCLYAREPGVLFAGDLVFADGAFGRTDIEGADRGTLVNSIDRLLEVVDEDLRAMHTGHGPSVTDDPYGDIELAARAARM